MSYVSVYYQHSTFLATDVDKKNSKERRDALSDMLKTGQSTFKFTVVSEPVDDDGDADCDEIGNN